MRLCDYEAMLVLRPNLDEDASAGVLERAKRAIEAKGGALQGIDRWGKRRLAYEIADQREGVSVLLRFQAPSVGGTAELEHFCRISDEILRHVIVRQVESGAPLREERGEGRSRGEAAGPKGEGRGSREPAAGAAAASPGAAAEHA